MPDLSPYAPAQNMTFVFIFIFAIFVVIVVFSSIWTSKFQKIVDLKTQVDSMGSDLEDIKASSSSIDSKLPDLTQLASRLMK